MAGPVWKHRSSPGPPVMVPGHTGQLRIGCCCGEVRGDFTMPLNVERLLLTGPLWCLLSHLNKSWGQATFTMATPFGSISASTLAFRQKCRTGNGASQCPSTVARLSDMNSSCLLTPLRYPEQSLKWSLVEFIFQSP